MTSDIHTVALPDIGEGVVEGEVIEWLKKEGDPVNQDEPVVIVMTDKATVELPAPYPGTIVKHYFKIGELAIKDRPLYDIQLKDGSKVTSSSAKSEKKKGKEKGTEADKAPKPKGEVRQKQPQKTGQGPEKVLAIPKVRHLAKELGIDLSKVHGTGKDGQIVLADLNCVKAASHSQAHHLQGDQEQSLVGIRGVMARRMDHTHIPQFSYFEQVDATRLIQLRENFKGKALSEGIRISYMPFFIRTLSLLAKRYPLMNSSLDLSAGKIILHQQVNIGVAIATAQGLIVPVLKDVQNMNLQEIIRAFEVLKNKYQAGKLAPCDMKDATITISNFGVLGEGIWATPMISESEVAILAVAKIRKIPVVRENEIVARDMLPLSWSFDHRVIDGELAAKISHDFCSLLHNPAALL